MVSEEVTFKLRPEGWVGVNQMSLWGRKVLSRRKSLIEGEGIANDNSYLSILKFSGCLSL